MDRWVLTLDGNDKLGYVKEVASKVREFLKEKGLYNTEIPENFERVLADVETSLTDEQKAEPAVDQVATEDKYNGLCIYEGMVPQKSAGTIEFFILDQLARELINTVNVRSKLSKLSPNRALRRKYNAQARIIVGSSF